MSSVLGRDTVASTDHVVDHAALAPLALQTELQILADAIRASSVCASDEWSTALSFPKGYFRNKVHQSPKIVACPSRTTIAGELARVYLDFADNEQAALEFKAALTAELEPIIIGIGKVRTLWTSDGVVVVRRDVWERNLFASHFFTRS